MLIKRPRGWELRESEATPEAAFLNRRELIAGSLAIAGAVTIGGPARAQFADPTFDLYPAKRNDAFKLDRRGHGREIRGGLQQLLRVRLVEERRRGSARPEDAALDGRGRRPRREAVRDRHRRPRPQDAARGAPLPAPLRRGLGHGRAVDGLSRCEAFLDLAKPLGSAKYVKMLTFHDKAVAPGPAPGLVSVALHGRADHRGGRNELAFLVTGVYGKPLAEPVRRPACASPCRGNTGSNPRSRWCGSPSRRSGRRASGRRCSRPNTASGPTSTRRCPHPRWSQATERMLGTDERRPTAPVQRLRRAGRGLYKGLESEKLYL